jgi:hypothetical protein
VLISSGRQRFPEGNFGRCLDYLVFVAELMHGLPVIICEILKVKFNWPPANVAQSFISVAHCPASQAPEEINRNVITPLLDADQGSRRKGKNRWGPFSSVFHAPDL